MEFNASNAELGGGLRSGADDAAQEHGDGGEDNEFELHDENDICAILIHELISTKSSLYRRRVLTYSSLEGQ